MKQPFQRLLWLFLAWRSMIFLVSYLGLRLLDPTHATLSETFQSFANWDGGHYLSIAQNGYVYNIQLAFLPGYSFLIKIFSFITFHNYLIAGLIVSNLSLFLFLNIFYLFVRQKFNHQIAWRTIIFLLLFPTSFFLGAVYSESTYLLFAVLALYFSSSTTKISHRWTWGWLFAMLASLTRITGFLVGLYVVSRYAIVKKSPQTLLFILLTFSGCLLYMLYLQLNYGNPWLFSQAQSHWNRQLFPVDPFLTLSWYHQHIFVYPITEAKYLIDYLFTIVLIILGVILYQKVDHRLGLYSLSVIIIPLLSGTLNSMPRFGLSAFPVFILLGIWSQKRWFALSSLAIFIPLLIIFTILFANQYWVA